MLKIKNIKYGLIPTGPALGVTALQLFFEEQEGEYTPDEYDLGTKWDQNKENKMIFEKPKELFESFLSILKEKDLVSQYETTINSSQSCFFVYMGGLIDNPDNFKEFNRFQVDLSNRVWNYQISIGVDTQKRKPPYSIFIGVPTYMSGKNQFYELFNTVYPIIHLEKDDFKKFNTLALQECFNGPFTLSTIFFEKESNFDRILSFKNKYKLLNHKICIIDLDSDKELLKNILSFNYRYYPYLKGTNFLKII